MAARKKIGLLILFPENVYQQRVIRGVFDQCEKYGYDVVVFSPQAQITNFFKEYLQGELNIFEYINFELLDGVIVAPITMTEDRITTLSDYLYEKLKRECTKPVVALDYEFGDYPVAYTEDKGAFYHIAMHCIKEHGCRKIMMLTGPAELPFSISRVEGVRAAMEEQGLTLEENMIRYGDFWYSSGEALGKELKNMAELPDAVICASDHMAIGLTNYLIGEGIRVPEQIIVTGYEATQDAMMNIPSITSYIADERRTGALAVNMLHEILEPETESALLPAAGEANLCIGGSCGCQEDAHYTRGIVGSTVVRLDHNYDDPEIWNKTDISMLLESYMTELLTSTATPLECINKIYETTYLLKPYGVFYLCLNENWLTCGKDFNKGYTDRMQLVLYSDMAKKLHGYANHVFVGGGRKHSFDRKQMLPQLSAEQVDIPDRPQVYYIVPIHFSEISLGVAVLQNDLSAPNVIGTIYRNYIRNINNALEMIRNRNRIVQISEHDLMTGLLNRRGMDSAVEYMRSQLEANPESYKNPRWLAFVIDMDSLKKINDTYGHECGDEGIIAVSRAAERIKLENEICVRSGGDEFIVLGLGDYEESEQAARIERLYEILAEQSTGIAGMHYSCSAGFALADYNAPVHEAVKTADANMYGVKRKKHDARINEEK